MVSFSSLLLGGRWRMNWCVSLGLGAINCPNGARSKKELTWPRNGLGRPTWADRPGPTSAQLAASFSRCWFPSLLDPSHFSMWALAVSFTPNWMKLLVLQDSALFWLGPQSFPSSRVLSLGFLESCLLHCMTCTRLQGLVTRCLMSLSWKSCFQH
jgi:hypothetical protein